MYQQRHRIVTGMLGPVEREAFTAIPGAAGSPQVSTMGDSLDELRRWCAAHGHLPSTSNTPGAALTVDGETERRLGQWVQNHTWLSASRGDEPLSRALADLAAEYPSWVVFRDRAKAVAVRQRLEAAGVMPRHNTEDGRWLDSMKRSLAAGSVLSDEALATLELAARTTDRTTARDQSIVDDLAQFSKQHGHRPRVGANATTAEKALAWKVRRRIEQSDGVADQLTAMVIDLPTAPLTRRRPSDSSVEAAAERLKLRGFLPTEGADLKLIQRCTELHSEGLEVSDAVKRLAALSDSMPSRREFVFAQRLEDYESFISRNRRLPRTSPRTERSLHAWAKHALHAGGYRARAVLEIHQRVAPVGQVRAA